MTGIELYSTLAHEGFPGHLYQTVSFSRSDPLLIRHLYAPSGYVEGWATYVESYACRYAARNLDANTQALCRLWYLNRSVHLILCSLLDLGIHSQDGSSRMRQPFWRSSASRMRRPLPLYISIFSRHRRTI